MTSRKNILLDERFAGLRPGPLTEVGDGPHREMHARPAHPDDNMDGWQMKAGHWSLGTHPWSCVEMPGGRVLRCSATATVADNTSIAKGDRDWADVTVETEVVLQLRGAGWGGPVGLLFRFLDSTRHYAAVLDSDGQAKLLKRVVGNCWDLLAAAPVAVAEGAPFRIVAEAAGDRLRAEVAGVVLEASDAEYGAGLVGLVAATPSEFRHVLVRCDDAERRRLGVAREQASKQLASRRSKAGQPVLWRKLDTRGFGSGRRIRLGDLAGDGRLGFLFPRMDARRGLAFLTATDAEGHVLWQRGENPGVRAVEASCDAQAQIYDVDGDGKVEVVCVMGDEVLVLEGATGKVKRAAPVPAPSPVAEIYKASVNHWGAGYDDGAAHMPVGAITLADLSGKGRASDIVLGGSYHQTIALDENLRELWRYVCPRGHFAIPYRPRGETRDHMLLGYHHVDADGKRVGRVCLTDHQDAIYAGPLDDTGTGADRILMAGGEDGLLLLTPEYDIHQRFMGHVQRLSIGKFREAPGLSVATVLFHHNRGIVSMFDSTLKRIWTRDYPVVGSTLQPVLFDASGVERMLFSGIRPSQGACGGLLDGNGDLVAPLPDDGGAGLCALAQDLDGDGLDELILWDHDGVWIYHSSAEAPSGALRQRERPPLWNMSNFQCYWSRPPRKASARE
jgi:hypothetical protein